MAGFDDFDQINDVVGEDDGNDKSFPYIYWRKPPLEDGAPGDIVYGPGWATEFMQRVKQRWTPLAEYGEFYNYNGAEMGDRGRAKPWRPHQEPYRRILLAEGGPAEFSLREILAYGWHRRAPYRGVRFPQLEDAAGRAHTDRACDLCDRKFLSERDLVRHQTIAHKTEASNEKQARALAGAMSQGNDNLAAALAEMQKAVAQQGAALAAVMADQAAATERFEKLLAHLVGQAGAKAAKA